eukprot:6404896-Ditylum_brightwellii.AAC.1
MSLVDVEEAARTIRWGGVGRGRLSAPRRRWMALAGRRCASPAGLNPERSVSEGTEEVPSSHRRRCAGARDLPASGVTRQAASVAA